MQGLGQNCFTTRTYNDDKLDGNPGAAPTTHTLDSPADVWTSGTKLIVADTGNNQPTDVVIAQPDMLSHSSAAGATGMDHPFSVTTNGVQLFATDAGNNRIPVFNTIPNGSQLSFVFSGDVAKSRLHCCTPQWALASFRRKTARVISPGPARASILP